jgi:hypothetical protein
VTQLGAYRGILRDDMAWMNVNGRPDPTQAGTFYRANLPRTMLHDLPSALASGVMTSVLLYLNEGDLITNLTFISGSTAAVTPANQWFALYNPAGALLQQTADQGAAAWATNTARTLPLAVPVKITRSGLYQAAVNVNAATPPSLMGCESARPVLTGEQNLAQASGSALAAIAPATITGAAWQRYQPLVIAN